MFEKKTDKYIKPYWINLRDFKYIQINEDLLSFENMTKAEHYFTCKIENSNGSSMLMLKLDPKSNLTNGHDFYLINFQSRPKENALTFKDLYISELKANVILKCPGSQNNSKLSEIRWFKNNSEISKKTIIKNNLHMVNLSQNDFGIFTCEFSNGHQNKSYKISLLKTGKRFNIEIILHIRRVCSRTRTKL